MYSMVGCHICTFYFIFNFIFIARISGRISFKSTVTEVLLNVILNKFEKLKFFFDLGHGLSLRGDGGS